MKRTVLHVLAALPLVLILLASNLAAQTKQEAPAAPAAAELTALLRQFLDGAGRNDAAMHDRFWAEDLIYTGSSGRRINKATLMQGVRSAPAPKPADPVSVYTAEDVRIQQFGDTAVVAFRLVATTNEAGKSRVAQFLNSGTFLKRDGKWQAVNWQATRLPRSEADVKQEIAAAQGAFQQAMLAGDVKTLESLLDESFIWTHRTGEQMTRKTLLDDLGSGALKYTKNESSNVTIAVTGDTVVVRGQTLRQRSTVPGSTPDAEPFTSYFTLVFAERGGSWRAVAMHTSRP